MLKQILIVLFFLGFVSQADAAFYFVRPGGTMSGCTASATPPATNAGYKSTPSAVAACLVAGDTAWHMTGSYPGIDNNVTAIASGTSYSNAVTFAVYPGEVATLTNSGANEILNLTSPTLKYVIFKDFRLDGGNTGFTVPGNGGVSFYNTVSFIKFENITHLGNTSNSCVGSNDARTHHLWFTGGSYSNCGSYGFYIESPDHIIENLTIGDTGRNGNPITTYQIHNFTNYAPFNTPSRNTYRNLLIYNGGGLLVWRGDQNRVHNVVVRDSNEGLSIGGGATNTDAYNITVYNPTTYAFNFSGSTGTTLKNFIHWGGSTTTFNFGASSITQSHGDCYVSGCTGTGAQNGVDPGFTNQAGNDFTLSITSPLINAGADVGLPCNAGCAIGAFDPPVLIAVDVGTAGANKITLTFDADAGPPLRTTTTFAAGWSALKTTVNNPIVSAALIGNAVIQLTTLSNYFSTDSCSVSYVQASGGLSDSVLIGGSTNQAFHTRTSVPCVNNVTGGGGATPVLTQLSYRVRELYGSETAAGWKTTAENTPYDVVINGAARVRVKSKAETAAPAAFNLGFQKRITLPGGSAGAKTTLTDTCSPTELACFFGTGTALGVANNTPTTEQLASTLANANCLVLLQNSTPNIQPGINTEWECEIAVKLDPALPKGSKVEIFMTRDGGAEFESYPANSIATLNVIDSQFIDGG